MKAKFTVYREGQLAVLPRAKRGWRWRLTAANGNIIADGGEAYSTKSNALRAVRDTVMLLACCVGKKNTRAEYVEHLEFIDVEVVSK